MGTKGKLRPLKNNDNAILRTAIVARSGATAVIATETPVKRFDDRTGQVVNEVLLMEGVQFRGGRDQIPIVDSHDDTTVRNVLGSIQGMRIDRTTGELFGTPVWSTNTSATEVARLVEEGHLTDFSITAIPLETLYVKRGDTFTTSRGEIIAGPAWIHTRWEPHNASICATGADVNSVIRRSYTDLERIERQMDEALLASLAGLGLPQGMTDPNQVLAWVVGKLGAQVAEESGEVESEMPPPSVEMMAGMDAEAQPKEETPVARMEEATELIKRALEADKLRRNEIQAACKLARIDREFADELCESGVSVEQASKRIIERMSTQPLGQTVGAEVRVTGSSQDKKRAAMLDGLIMRSARSSRVKRSLYTEGDAPAAGAHDFAQMSLVRLAMECLEDQKIASNKFNNVEIARIAMGNTSALRNRIERSDFQPYHTSGTFANILLDAANKTLLAAYEEAPYSWNLWARQGASAQDFKTLYRTRFSEAPNPEEVPEGADYPEKVMTDSKESYRVAKFGESFTVSWETIVNDDLDAISRVPAMHGNAMRRMQNKKVYEVLTSNPVMGDGFNLFSSSHVSGDNTSGTAAAPSVATLNAGFVKMMSQKGQTSDAYLNIIPKFLIVPLSYSATAEELVRSTSYAVSNGNQGIQNIYGVNGSRSLMVITDPNLEANSTTTWYLAADPAQCDTVELTFLAGEESPVLESEWNIKNDSYIYKIRQTFGVKAIDWRGLYRNA